MSKRSSLAKNSPREKHRFFPRLLHKPPFAYGALSAKGERIAPSPLVPAASCCRRVPMLQRWQHMALALRCRSCLLVLQEHLAACSRLPSRSAIMFLLHGVVLADLTAQTTTSGLGA